MSEEKQSVDKVKEKEDEKKKKTHAPPSTKESKRKKFRAEGDGVILIIAIDEDPDRTVYVKIPRSTITLEQYPALLDHAGEYLYDLAEMKDDGDYTSAKDDDTGVWATVANVITKAEDAAGKEWTLIEPECAEDRGNCLADDEVAIAIITMSLYE